MLINTLSDNEALFITNLFDVIRHADSEASITHMRNLNSIIIIVSPSSDEFKESIITNLVNFHRTFHLKVTFSKSLAVSKRIIFSIDLENYT